MMSTDILFWIGGALLGLIGLTLLTWALIGDRSKGRRRCPKCWYDLSKTQGLRCSECGREARSEKKLFKSRRRWRWAFVSLFVLIGGALIFVQPRVRRYGWVSILPNSVLVLALHGPRPDWVMQELHRRVVTSPLLVMPLEIDARTLADWQWRVCIEGLANSLHARPTSQLSWDAIELLDGSARSLQSHMDVSCIYDALYEIDLDADPIIRIAAVTLTANDPNYSRAIERLSVALLDDDPSVRLSALFALVRLPVIEHWYDFPEQWGLVSRFAAKSPPSIEQFLERYDDKKFDEARSQAVSLALESVGVTSGDPELKGASLVFASILHGEHGLHFIYTERAIVDEHDAVVAAGFTIAQKLHPDSISKAMIDRTIESLESSSERVRHSASDFLLKIDPRRLLQFVDDLESVSFRSDDQNVRWAARETLRKLYPIIDGNLIETAAPQR